VGSPAILNSRLYINLYDGRMYCFCDDSPPEKPIKPSGPTVGKVGVLYDYSTSTTDPNGDMVKYGWDWNSDKVVDEWTSFYPSGATVTTSHSWEKMGINKIRVRAENTVGTQSEWSNPRLVIMPKMQQKYIDLQTIYNSLNLKFKTIFTSFFYFL
jgi:hypothetical protein